MSILLYEKTFKEIYSNYCTIIESDYVIDYPIRTCEIEVKENSTRHIIIRELFTYNQNETSITTAKEITYKELFLNLLRYTNQLSKLQKEMDSTRIDLQQMITEFNKMKSFLDMNS